MRFLSESLLCFAQYLVVRRLYFRVPFLTFTGSRRLIPRLSLTMMEKLHLLAATQVRDMLQNSTITVEEYARSLLERIEERDGIVKAWAFLGRLFPSHVYDPTERYPLILRQIPHLCSVKLEL